MTTAGRDAKAALLSAIALAGVIKPSSNVSVNEGSWPNRPFSIDGGV
ncbi:MAG TPA: hypothetical protein VND94_16815 [Terriglobia bacterium]|nr:hypothetical protein [Terriglobia bacterium]